MRCSLAICLLVLLGCPEVRAADDEDHIYLNIPVRTWVKMLKNEDDRGAALGACRVLGPKAKSAATNLVLVLKSDEVRDRRAAAEIIGMIEPDPKIVVAPLAKALEEDEDGIVQKHAAESLGNLGPAAKDAVPALVKALSSKEYLVARISAMALGKIGPDAKAAVPALVAAWNDRKHEARQFAGEALKKIDAVAARRAGVK